MIPRSISTGLGEIESFFSLRWASLLPGNRFALYCLALQLVFLPSRIFSTTISQASLPALSKRLAQNQMAKFKSLVVKILFQALFLSMPVAVIFLIYRLPIIRLVFGSKNFPWSATKKLAQTIIFLSPSIVLQSIIQVLNRAFYAAQNTKTPLNISLKSLGVGLAIAYILVKFTSLEIFGLAIGITVSNFIQAADLITSFSSKINHLNYKKLFIRFTKILIPSVLMALVAWASIRLSDQTIFDTTRTLNLLLLTATTSILSLAVYLFVAYLFKVKEIKDILKLLKKRSKLFDLSKS